MKTLTYAKSGSLCKLLSLLVAIAFFVNTVAVDFAFALQLPLNTADINFRLTWDVLCARQKAFDVTSLLESPMGPDQEHSTNLCQSSSPLAKAYTRVVFNKKDFASLEDLAVTGLVRDAGGKESVKQLSSPDETLVEPHEILIYIGGRDVALRIFDPDKAPNPPEGYIAAAAKKDMGKNLRRELIYSAGLDQHIRKLQAGLEARRVPGASEEILRQIEEQERQLKALHELLELESEVKPAPEGPSTPPAGGVSTSRVVQFVLVGVGLSLIAANTNSWIGNLICVGSVVLFFAAVFYGVHLVREYLYSQSSARSEKPRLSLRPLRIEQLGERALLSGSAGTLADIFTTTHPLSEPPAIVAQPLLAPTSVTALPAGAIPTPSNPDYYYMNVPTEHIFKIYAKDGTQLAHFEKDYSLSRAYINAAGTPDVSPDGKYAIVAQITDSFYTGAHYQKSLIAVRDIQNKDVKGKAVLIEDVVDTDVRAVSGVRFITGSSQVAEVTYKDGSKVYYDIISGEKVLNNIPAVTVNESIGEVTTNSFKLSFDSEGLTESDGASATLSLNGAVVAGNALTAPDLNNTNHRETVFTNLLPGRTYNVALKIERPSTGQVLYEKDITVVTAAPTSAPVAIKFEPIWADGTVSRETYYDSFWAMKGANWRPNINGIAQKLNGLGLTTTETGWQGSVVTYKDNVGQWIRYVVATVNSNPQATCLSMSEWFAGIPDRHLTDAIGDQGTVNVRNRIVTHDGNIEIHLNNGRVYDTRYSQPTRVFKAIVGGIYQYEYQYRIQFFNGLQIGDNNPPYLGELIVGSARRDSTDIRSLTVKNIITGYEEVIPISGRQDGRQKFAEQVNKILESGAVPVPTGWTPAASNANFAFRVETYPGIYPRNRLSLLNVSTKEINVLGEVYSTEAGWKGIYDVTQGGILVMSSYGLGHVPVTGENLQYGIYVTRVTDRINGLSLDNRGALTSFTVNGNIMTLTTSTETIYVDTVTLKEITAPPTIGQWTPAASNANFAFRVESYPAGGNYYRNRLSLKNVRTNEINVLGEIYSTEPGWNGIYDVSQGILIMSSYGLAHVPAPGENPQYNIYVAALNALANGQTLNNRGALTSFVNGGILRLNTSTETIYVDKTVPFREILAPIPAPATTPCVSNNEFGFAVNNIGYDDIQYWDIYRGGTLVAKVGKGILKPDVSPDDGTIIVAHSDSYPSAILQYVYVIDTSTGKFKTPARIELSKNFTPIDMRFAPGSSTLVQVTYGNGLIINYDTLTGKEETPTVPQPPVSTAVTPALPSYTALMRDDERAKYSLAEAVVAGLVIKHASPEAAVSLSEAYMTNNIGTLKQITAEPMFLRMPVEVLNAAKEAKDNGTAHNQIVEFLMALSALPNVYVELCSTKNPDAKTGPGDYAAHGLDGLFAKAEPYQAINRTKKNTVTLCAVSGNDISELEASLRTSRLLQNSIPIPVGINSGARGVEIAANFGAKLILIARNKADEQSIRNAINEYNGLAGANTKLPNLTVRDVLALVGDGRNFPAIIDALKKLVNSIPMDRMPLDKEVQVHESAVAAAKAA